MLWQNLEVSSLRESETSLYAKLVAAQWNMEYGIANVNVNGTVVSK